MTGSVEDKRHAEQRWNESFSEGIREDAEHYELAKHLNAKTHEIVEEFVYDPARALLPEQGTFLDRMEDFDKDRISDFVNTHDSSPNSPEPGAR